jgi:hypothetical protein
MNLKIKTITCHEVYNYGAILQEYALVEYLRLIGNDAATIHYKPYHINFFNFWEVPQKWNSNFFLKYLYLVLKLPKRIINLRRKSAFDKFSNKYLNVDSRVYIDNEDLKRNLPIADVFICGSDQIWNSYYETGRDPSFYLDFVPDDVKKVSYAASFALDEIDEQYKSFVKEKVSRINHVSVREESGKKILENLNIKNVNQVVDPVFLLDEEHWKKNFITPFSGDYILIYDFDNNHLIKKLALELAKKKNYKIYTVNENIKYADKNYYLKGPEVYLSLMYNAKYVITNSFHSVAFSLIFNKQFLVVNRNEAINTRMRDLLQLFNLPQLLVSDGFTVEQIKIIDFSEVNLLKKDKINNAKEFLFNALKS